MAETGTFRVKRGLAEMLKGGVIMDVVTADEARIAEEAGAVAVMALERVPADIRRDGGVARMSDPSMIRGIQEAVTIPVMAKARIGHFAEAQVLRGARGRLHRRVRGADARRRGQPHRQARVRDPVRLRRHRPRRGAAPDRRGRGDDPLEGRGRAPATSSRRSATCARSRPGSSGSGRSVPRSSRPRPRSCGRRSTSSRRSRGPAGCPCRCSAPAGSRRRPTRR